jgi:hypothetical protein
VAKKKKQLKTVLTFVQDETGSMMGIADRTISAFNEYFDTLKKEKDIGDVETIIWQFSDTQTEARVRKLHEGPLADVPTLDAQSYRPRGVTPLLDAVGTAIQQAEGKKADRHLFIVQTDGLENASVDFTREEIAKLVAKKEKAENWTLVFLGAGIANWVSEARAMGATGQSVTSYDPGDQTVAYASLSSTAGAFLRTNSVKAHSLGSDTEKEIKRRKKTTPKS